MKFVVHGPAVEIDCAAVELAASIAHLLAPFAVDEWPAGFGVTRGSIRPYDHAEVIRRLPTSARALHRPQDHLELYHQDERFWIIDDRWGMCEINILRGHWRTWVLPNPRLDRWRLAEMAVLRPLAHLLNNRQVHLLPAASVQGNGLGILVLSGIDVEPELETLRNSGFRVIGHHWTALRSEAGGIALLPMAMEMAPSGPPRLRDARDERSMASGDAVSARPHAFCNAVLVAEAGRRPRAHLREVRPQDAMHLLRRAWPIPQLHPGRRAGYLPAKLATSCRAYQLQLSRDPRDLSTLLLSLQTATCKRTVA